MAVNPADVQKHLSEVAYPADKDELVNAARASGADDEIVDALSSLEERSYESPTDVVQALGTAP